MKEQMFKLMVPCGHPTPYRIEGAIGGTPDVTLIRRSEKCCRYTLPPFLESLVFNFVEQPGYGARVQTFYHIGDFFVVSNTVKEFLEANAGCRFEAKMIRTKHPNNEITEQYWAMKVTTRVDCVLPSQSFAKGPSWSEPAKPFSDLALELKLSTDISPYFANRGSDTYYAYPSAGVKNVSMDFSLVPDGVRLFEPMYWPQFLVIDDTFSKELYRQCGGGTMGYYFWKLGFDDVSNELGKAMQALR